MHTLKLGHRQQLELVDTRLQQVIAKKDNAMAALRGELATMHSKLHQLEQLAN